MRSLNSISRATACASMRYVRAVICCFSWLTVSCPDCGLGAGRFKSPPLSRC